MIFILFYLFYYSINFRIIWFFSRQNTIFFIVKTIDYLWKALKTGTFIDTSNWIYYQFTTFKEKVLICTTTRTKHTDRTTYRKSLPWQHFFAPQNVGKRNAVFHLQCYAIEHRFQGAEYNSLISAFFVSASRLNQEEKGFYCVTIYPSQKGVSTKQLTKCDI